MSKSPDLPQRVTAELEDMRRDLEDIRPLIQKLKLREPDGIEVRAAASTIHSFYNGVERVFSAIAAEVDGEMPQGHRWHRDLLEQMSQSTERREAVIEEALRRLLLDYAAFRHFYRHSYGHTLKWHLIKPLFDRLAETHRRVQTATEMLLSSLQGDDSAEQD